MRYSISTPVPDFAGIVAGVTFANGTAEVSTDVQAGRRALSYFRQAGYVVAPVSDSTEEPEPANRKKTLARRKGSDTPAEGDDPKGKAL
jgi:hypothetical protein